MSVLTNPAHLDRLIDRNLGLSEVRRRAEGEPGRATSAGCWVSLSRQIGSGGTGIAATLASRLDWQVFDKEVLDAVARQTHVREKLLARLDERTLSPIEEWVSHLIVPDHLGSTGFNVEVMRVMGALAWNGHAVLIGRGANWFLDPRHGLRLRVVAPLERRIAAVGQRLGIDSAAAGRLVAEDDARRTTFIRRTFQRDIDDPTGYDIVVNTELVGVDGAVEIAMAALRRKLPRAVEHAGTVQRAER